MEHRHLDTPRWSAAAVDSALERGGLADWRELFAAVRSDPALGEVVLRVARRHGSGAGALATALVGLWRGEGGAPSERRDTPADQAAAGPERLRRVPPDLEELELPAAGRKRDG